MTNLEETKLVSFIDKKNFNFVAFEIGCPVSVHSNRQAYSEHSPSQGVEKSTQEVETVIKDQLITEYEFYNYIKRRLAGQATALHVQ